ncbi:polysaccharide deacetylase family protein [Paenibacillus caui]|uniref:polysaccharide deacetylase family protein n=1 Tax=Paenibacillus caui TaxID=2873927 RepID=UPI001CA824BA|nr:polysaccharide deacetylase family protein [Paenibacillus caui]
MSTNQSFFVISIDFELYWGLRDLFPLARYRRGLARERELIPRMLQLFERHGIHATWATVGLLFLESKEEIQDYLPSRLPEYIDSGLSPYPHIAGDLVGTGEEADPDHYAPSLIRLIRETPYQRVGTHTFSHYYCKEMGQSGADFLADLEAAVRLAKQRGIRIESIVFPRNQVNEGYLPCLKRLGIRSYRGNPRHPIYKKGYSKEDSLLARAFRLLDSYVNVSGFHTYSIGGLESELPLNIPASHFFRSYSRRLGWLEPLRLKRILNGMTYAAKHNQVYHLWWHPYNLVDRKDRNWLALERIIAHYSRLEHDYGMRSAAMEELCDFITGRRDEKS